MTDPKPRRPRPAVFIWKKAVFKGLRGAAIAGAGAAAAYAQQAVKDGKTDLAELGTGAAAAGISAAIGFLFELGRNWVKNR